MHLKDLISSLEFSLEELPSAIMSQPKLLLEASRFRVSKLRKRQELEATFATQSSYVLQKLRKEETGKRITEAYLRERSVKDPRIVKAQQELDEARAVEVWGKHLLDAYHERGSMIKALVQLMGAEAALEMKLIKEEHMRMGGKELRRRVRAKYPGGGDDDD